MKFIGVHWWEFLTTNVVVKQSPENKDENVVVMQSPENKDENVVVKQSPENKDENVVVKQSPEKTKMKGHRDAAEWQYPAERCQRA